MAFGIRTGSGGHRRAGQLMSGTEGYNFTLAPFNQRQYVLAPTHQRGPHFVSIRAVIIDAGHTSPITAVVVQRGFDHMRVDLDVAHARGDGAAEIAQLPRLY